MRPTDLMVARLRLLPLFATASLLASLLGVAIPPSPVAADCGLEPNWHFSTSGAYGGSPISRVFFGTVTAVRSPDWKAEVDVRLDHRVDGIAGRSFVFSGQGSCGSITLEPGHRYLFAVAPDGLSISGSMVFETDGPAWRWVVTGGRIQPLLDGHVTPVDPDRLLAFLRTRVTQSRRAAHARVEQLVRRGCGTADPLRDPTKGTWAQVRLQPAGEVRMLTVGALDGSGWVVMRDAEGLRISGPVAGRVLAQHREDGRTVVDLVDIRRGTVRRMDGVPADATGVTLDASGCAWYWFRSTDNGKELWGRALASGATAVRLARSLWMGGPVLVQSVDGRRMAVVDGAGWFRDAWTIDRVDGSIRWLDLPNGARLLPDLGERRVLFLVDADVATVEGGGPASSLARLDPWTGRTRVVLARIGGPIRVVGAGDPPVGAWRASDDGIEQLRWFRDGSDVAHRLPLPDGAGDLVIDGDLQGVDAPGWIPVFPGGVAVGGADASGPRLVISPTTGAVVELPPVR